MPELTIVPVKIWQTITPSRVSEKGWINSDGTEGEVNKRNFVPKLVAAFQADLTVQEACDYAGLPKRTFYNWLKEDPVFAEEMRKAKEFPKTAAKNKVMSIINKGSDRDAGPMARWLLEKRAPEIYGQSLAIPIGQQNNFFILKNEQLSELTKRSDIINSDPSELLEALETAPAVDVRPEETSLT